MGREYSEPAVEPVVSICRGAEVETAVRVTRIDGRRSPGRTGEHEED